MTTKLNLIPDYSHKISVADKSKIELRKKKLDRGYNEKRK